MDSLISRANKADGKRRRSTNAKAGPSSSKDLPKAKSSADSATLSSIERRTSLPHSLKPTGDLPESTKKHGHIKNKNLRLELDRKAEHAARAKAMREDAALLTEAVGADPGKLETEDAMERTWRVTQAELAKAVGGEAARQQKEYRLDGGPYRCRYTRNGRHMAIVGKLGHVASFDWQTGTMHAELQLRETCRDITYLHDQSFFAVAQKKYVYIYDQDGVEIHKLTNHIEPARLEFLPFHWLLASVGNAGHLKYQDTSTGQLVASHKTGLGPCSALAQDAHSAVLHLGHQNGRVTLWTPNMAQAAVTLQAHRGPITSLSVDPSDSGRYLATSGVDGTVKVWDCRSWGVVREWTSRGGGGEVEFSAKGTLAVSSGGTITTYNAPQNHTPVPNNPRAPPPLYLTHPIPSRPLNALRFCPYSDILTIGHSKGLSSILIPGSGDPHFDSLEADPYENRKMRREREVRNLLDKISPELITVSGPQPGALVPAPKATLPGGEGKVADMPYARLPRIDRLRVSGKYDATDELQSDEDIDLDEAGSENETDEMKAKRERMKEKVVKKMRGKNKAMKRYIRKHRKNVIDPQTVAIRAKLEKQREERRREKALASGQAEERRPSVLDRFRRQT